MGVLMKKILEGFGYGIIQDCFGLLKTLEKKDFSNEDFLNFVEKYRKQESAVLEKQIEKNKPKIKENKSKFIVPGELVKMKGVVCSKCGSEVYTTAVCCSNPLKLQGFLRKTICSSCGLETGQK